MHVDISGGLANRRDLPGSFFLLSVHLRMYVTGILHIDVLNCRQIYPFYNRD